MRIFLGLGDAHLPLAGGGHDLTQGVRQIKGGKQSVKPLIQGLRIGHHAQPIGEGRRRATGKAVKIRIDQAG